MIDGNSVRGAQKVKYFGLMVDETFNWNKQCKYFKHKVKCGLSSIRKLVNMLPQTKLEYVYRTLVEYHLRYGNQLCGSSSDTELDYLQDVCHTQARGPNFA